MWSSKVPSVYGWLIESVEGVAAWEQKQKRTRPTAVKIKGVCFGGEPTENPYRVIDIFDMNLNNLGEKLMTVSSLTLSRGGLKSSAMRRRAQSGDVGQKGGQNI